MNIQDLATFCKSKGFVYQSAEIYGGLAGFWDFGPFGVEIKNAIKQSYWKYFVQSRTDMVGQDGSIITNPKVWKASGHVDNFADLLLTTKKSKTKIRADHFIEDQLNISADGMKADDINKLIKEHSLTYNGEEFEEIKDFNLMFHTQVGPDVTSTATAFLRPETCQSIFPNFRLVSEHARMKLPFGICQVGKAFRNEISPRDFVFRSREFEQMEMEYFYNPNVEFDVPESHKEVEIQFYSAEAQAEDGEATNITVGELIKTGKMSKLHAYWVAEFMIWLTKHLQLSKENLRIREHIPTELSHYSSGTFDIDYKYPFGFKEMIGIADRGTYDLTQHQDHSKSKLEYFDDMTNEKLIPSCMEPSCGVERIFMAVITEAYEDDKERGNIVLKLPPKLAPVQVGVFPLVNKVKEKGLNIFELLREEFVCQFDTSGSIGKRYARSDELGTPLCITVDFEEGVTIRERDSTKQIRVKEEDVIHVLYSYFRGEEFTDLGELIE